MKAESHEWAADAKLALDWFIESMGQDEWFRRRKNVVLYFKSISRKMYTDFTDKQAIDDKKIMPFAFYDDWISWYMYLIECLFERPLCNDNMQASRIYPFFAAIGEDLKALKEMHGIEKRIANILNERQNQPDAGLFELATALLYYRNGWAVSFLDETSAGKTPDLQILRDGKKYFVECKRMIKANSYVEEERTECLKRVNLLLNAMHLVKKPMFADITFKVPIKDVPENQLVLQYLDYIKAGYSDTDQILSTPEIDIKAKTIDLENANSQLAIESISPNSPKLIEILLGSYDMHGGYHHLLRASKMEIAHEEDDLAVLNHFYAEIGEAYMAKWNCISEKSVDLKAKDFKKILSQAIKQIPEGEEGIIHIGYETVTGTAIELKRQQKIDQVVNAFDFGSKKIIALYGNAIQFLAVPTGSDWAVTTISYENSGDILQQKLLIDLPGHESTSSTHWE